MGTYTIQLEWDYFLTDNFIKMRTTTTITEIKNDLISAKIILDRINMYKTRLSESKTVSDTKFKNMNAALFGVKLIIADLLIDNNNLWNY